MKEISTIRGEFNRWRAEVVAPYDEGKNAASVFCAEGDKITPNSPVFPTGQTPMATFFLGLSHVFYFHLHSIFVSTN